jgi:hypothetical protein
MTERCFRILVKQSSDNWGYTQKASIIFEEFWEPENNETLLKKEFEMLRDQFFKWRDSVRSKFGENFAENDDGVVFQDNCVMNALSTAGLSNLISSEEADQIMDRDIKNY